MMTQLQALELSTLLYEAFSRMSEGGDGVAGDLLELAQLIEANEMTPGGIGSLRAHLSRTHAPQLRIVK